MLGCIFCSIVQEKEKLVWESEYAAAFKDIHPKAKVHVLIVPKGHVENLDDLNDEALGGQLLQAVREVANLIGVRGGYAVKIHNGRRGGQEIDHLHLHLLAD